MKLPPRVRQSLRRMHIPRYVWRAAGLASISAIGAWWSTLHYRIAMYDPTVDPVHPGYRGPGIYIFWHEYIPMLIHMRPNCRLSMLLSRHQDAEIISHVADFAGLGTVRGSSYRGGSAALRKLIQGNAGINLAITPDGPRGPRRRLAPGCVYLSARLQVPIVPVGIGYDRPWRLQRTWDKFAVPRPFSRCRSIVGPPIQVPQELDRNGLEAYRATVERALDLTTLTAERWAAGEIEIAGARNFFRSSPSPLRRFRSRVPESTDQDRSPQLKLRRTG